MAVLNPEEPLYRDKTWLKEKYEKEKLNEKEIAKICDVTIKTIGDWLRKFSISIRSQMKSQEKYEKELQDKFEGNIKPLEEYNGKDTKIKHICTICGHKWKTSPHILLRCQYGCPECAEKGRCENMGKSHEQYKKELRDVTKTIIPLERYQTIHKKIKHRCTVCDYEWKTEPNVLLKGHGCPACQDMAQWTRKAYEDFLKNKPIKLGDKFENASTKVEHICSKCDFHWQVTPDSVMRGSGCPECAGNRKLTQEEYKERVQSVHDVRIEVLGQYQNINTPIKHKCKHCGLVWKPRPGHVIHSGSGCPRCAQSRGEDEIEETLKDLNLNFQQEVKFEGCRNKQKLPFDFEIRKANETLALIEFDGKQHYTPIQHFGGKAAFWNRVQRDKIKNDFAFEEDIPLLRLNYLEKEKDQIRSHLEDFLAQKQIV